MIHLDETAAGWGWFVSSNESDSVPANQLDLLTALVHELGHALGLQHAAGDGLMGTSLSPGTRTIDGLAGRLQSQQGSEASKLIDGLDAFGQWTTNLDQYLLDELLSIDLPFGSVSLPAAVPDLGVTDLLKSKVDQLEQSVRSYLDAAEAPTVDGLIDHLAADLSGDGISVQRTGGAAAVRRAD